MVFHPWKRYRLFGDGAPKSVFLLFPDHRNMIWMDGDVRLGGTKEDLVGRSVVLAMLNGFDPFGGITTQIGGCLECINRFIRSVLFQIESTESLVEKAVFR